MHTCEESSGLDSVKLLRGEISIHVRKLNQRIDSNYHLEVNPMLAVVNCGDYNAPKEATVMLLWW